MEMLYGCSTIHPSPYSNSNSSGLVEEYDVKMAMTQVFGVEKAGRSPR